MTIYRILQNTPFDPEEVEVLVSAYETTLRELSLKHRSDPLTEMVAKKVIEIRQTGISDPAQICHSRLNSSDARHKELPGAFGSMAKLLLALIVVALMSLIGLFVWAAFVL